jgi:hypothetical protein
MRKFAGRIAFVTTCLSLVLPGLSWAGSAQATLSVGVVVPARCALRVVGALQSAEPSSSTREAVVMKCTKGTLPSGDRATPSRAGAADPRVTQHLVPGASPAIASAPQPLSEQGFAASTDGAGPRLIVTVNF